MKILQLAARLPYPLVDGGAVGIFKIAESVALLGHEVTFVSYPHDDEQVTREAIEVMSKFCRLELVRRALPSRASTLARTIFRGAYPIERRMMPEMYQLVERLIRENDFDVVHLDHSHMGKYGLWIKREFGLPVVLRQHNFETIIYERFASFVRNPAKKWLASMHGRRMRQEEGAIVRAMDAVAAISEQDVEFMREVAPDANYHVIPAGVDTEYFKPTPDVSETPGSILWIGGMDWDPNFDAITHFCRDILPLIRQEVPEARLEIVGSAQHRIKHLASDKVILHGRVPDVRDYLAHSAVLVVPLRIGGGMRLKLLDFFASGKAVVSTRIGAEGNVAVDDVHLLLRDDARSFAEAVVRLLRDFELRQRLGVQARELAVREYGWRSIGERFCALYEGVRERSSSRRQSVSFGGPSRN